MIRRFMRWCFASLVRAYVTELFRYEWNKSEPLLPAQAGAYSLFGDAVNAQLERVKEHMDKVKNISAQEINQLKERNLADRKTILRQNERIGDLSAIVLGFETRIALLEAKQVK